jgi:CRP/FNR family transcriptional regulator, cyclic AMP receptor protein
MNDALQETIKELQKIPWFQELEKKHLEKVASITTLRHVRPDEVLFHEGDKEDNLYIVIAGRIALEIFIPQRGKIRIYTVEPQDLFGWSSVTPVVHQRTAGATSVMDGLIACIDSEKLRQLCEEDHDLGYVVMRRLANIVASRLLVTRLQLLDMFSHPESQNAK